MDQELKIASSADAESPRERQQLFVFVHIPKTAGTSLRNALAKRSNLCLDYGPDDAATSPKSKSILGDAFVAEPGTIYFGHYDAKYIDERFDESVVRFGWVRDPIDRVISAFMHDRWIGARNTDLEDPNTLAELFEFVADPYQQNVMSSYLTEMWESFDFIGVVEHNTASVRRFGRRLIHYGLVDRGGVGVEVENANPARRDFYYKSLNESLISFIATKNMRDLMLYRNVVSKYIGR